jgi:sRNA-binding regulator protein Hfq
MMFLNSKRREVHDIRVFLENGLGSFQTFIILQVSDKAEVLKRFQKQF